MKNPLTIYPCLCPSEWKTRSTREAFAQSLTARLYKERRLIANSESEFGSQIALVMEAAGMDNLTELASNATAGQPVLKTVHDYLLVVLLVAVMFAMGCHITWEQVSKLLLIVMTFLYTIIILGILSGVTIQFLKMFYAA